MFSSSESECTYSVSSPDHIILVGRYYWRINQISISQLLTNLHISTHGTLYLWFSLARFYMSVKISKHTSSEIKSEKDFHLNYDGLKERLREKCLDVS